MLRELCACTHIPKVSWEKKDMEANAPSVTVEDRVRESTGVTQLLTTTEQVKYHDDWNRYQAESLQDI
jgi:hypothetical protein